MCGRLTASWLWLARAEKVSVKLAVCLRSWQIWQGSVNEISARVDEWVHVAGFELLILLKSRVWPDFSWFLGHFCQRLH